MEGRRHSRFRVTDTETEAQEGPDTDSTTQGVILKAPIYYATEGREYLAHLSLLSHTHPAPGEIHYPILWKRKMRLKEIRYMAQYQDSTSKIFKSRTF